MFRIDAFKLIVAGLLLALIGYIVILRVNLTNIKKNHAILSNNYKASQENAIVWKDKYNQEHYKVIKHESTLRMFVSSKDSLDIAVRKAIAEGKIKIKDLQQAGIIITELQAELKLKPKTTTVYAENDSVRCDTLQDVPWVRNIICFNSQQVLSSELSVSDSLIFYDGAHKKETINPPRKFFLWRLFQKKHTLYYVEVVHTNPYMKTKKARLTKIIQ